MKLESIKTEIYNKLKNKLNQLKVTTDEDIRSFVITVWWDKVNYEAPNVYENEKTFRGKKKELATIYNNQITPFIEQNL
ncbi:hypothetical protein ATE84_4693 [Aquimarina sp. MAR_2010_214]|uniref:hypothetical protein n=1 Tax=Aquimarina sp. MAR_2010_214 TaxID=1250026 RepID=UPI000C7038E6|nr:hypothetical protein [Aquimarina sp. MAR_2010_214]PKV52573.1 hypothetical protein ATE84_4693 [Aquimarina sp. MAR_2010_214]